MRIKETEITPAAKKQNKYRGMLKTSDIKDPKYKKALEKFRYVPKY